MSVINLFRIKLIALVSIGIFQTTMEPDAKADEVAGIGGRLLYKIVVTDPGTRSQGWKGTLFDRNGQPLDVEPGKTVRTRIGDFVSVACDLPWVPCGMIHASTLASTLEVNIVLDTNPAEYRLYVTAEGTKSEGWQGELQYGSKIIKPQFDRVLAPMGFFVWSQNPDIWGPHGWIPETWVRAPKAANKGILDDAEAALERLKEQAAKKFEARRPAACACVRG